MLEDIELLKSDDEALERLIADYRRLREQSAASAQFDAAQQLEFMKAALDAGSDTFVVYDPDGKLCFYNQSFEALMANFGVAIATGQTFEQLAAAAADAMHGDAADEQKQAWVARQRDFYERALASGRAVEALRDDGRYERIIIRRLPTGHMFDFRSDITQEKRRQLDLDMILSSTDQGIVSLDRDGRVQLINPAYIKMFGFEEMTITPETTFEDMWTYLRTDGVLAGRFDDDAAWEAYRREIVHQTERAKIEPQTSEVGDKKFKFIFREFTDGRSMFCAYDVTKLERQKEALAEETANAQAAERAKSEFLANMSHEIRTPMNGVMGMAELLMDTDLDARQRTFADTILRSGEALLTIINDILDFSKITAGQIALNPAPFVLREAIEDVVTLVAPRAAAKPVELAARISPDLPEAYRGDVGRIRQIITNLVGNAVKFTDAGHVVVQVTGRVDGPADAPTAALQISVKDTGVGIPADKCDTIFDKFTQVDASAARRHEGTGLGLSITKSLVDLMGGEISVESSIDEGSVFTVRLPLPVHGDGKSAPVAAHDVSNSRILVVDDNAVNRSILLEQMSSWGFQAKSAASGEEALDLFEAATVLGAPFDLAVLDYQMPTMTGADLVARIRADKRFCATPVIMLTSVDQTNDGTAFGDLGVDAHLTKPARSSLLLDSVVQSLQRAKSAQNVAADEKTKTVSKPAYQDTTLSREAEARAPASTPSSAATEGEAADVLVAEDNAVNQIVFAQSLQSLGVTFQIAENGKEALALFHKHAPQLVLMDVSMPEMNGFEATAAIRAYEEEHGAQRTPIVGVTAHAMAGDREKCLAAGMDDYLPKPISPARLGRMIDKWRRGAAEVKTG